MTLIIHSLNPTGAFSYGESETLDIEKRGIINLKGMNDDSGGSNGAGKTSLFNTLCVILFGENPTGVKDIDVPNAVWGKGMSCRCEFTGWEGVRYRVTYCRDWKSNSYYPVDNNNQTSYVGTSLFLDKYSNGSWIDCRKKSMKDTRESIIQAVGINYNNFLSTSYMSHRVGNRFLRGTNKDRIDTLTRITGVDEWDKILDNSRSRKRSLESDIEAVKRDIAFSEGSKRELESNLSRLLSVNWTERSESLEAELVALRGEYSKCNKELDEAKKAVQAKIIERDSSYSSDRVDSINLEISKKRNELQDFELKLSNLSFREDHRDPDYLSLRNLEKDVISLQANINVVKGDSILSMKECPTCGTKITKKKREAVEEKVEVLEKKLKEAEVLFNEGKDKWEAKKVKMQAEVDSERSVLSNRTAELRKEINDLQLSVQSELNHYHELDSIIRERNVSVERLNNKLSHINSQGELKKSELNTVNSNLKSVSEIKERLLEIDIQVKGYMDSISDTQVQINVFDWLVKNIPYIKLHKLTNSMEELTNLVNECLSKMGDTIRVNISSFDEKVKKKNAADIKDLLKSEVNVSITDGDKKIDPKLYSDGEISKISNAFIRSLSELARKFGYGCNIMLLDEIFSFIDTDNSQKLSDSFRRDMLNRGTIFVTDNSGIVDNLLSFDEVWTAVKKTGKTRIEVVSEGC
jgi:DNA repair exonuclease SbcCD ATPase subunit